MNIQQRIVPTKKIVGGNNPTRVVLFELNDSLDVAVQTALLPTAVGFDASLLPTTYPGGLSYNYVIDETRATQLVLDDDAALALGSGVIQSVLAEDTSAVSVGVITGSNPGGDIYSPSFVARLVNFVATKLHEWNYTPGSGPHTLANTVLFRTGQLVGIDQAAFLTDVGAALTELITPTVPDFANLSGEVIADGEAVAVGAAEYTPPIGVSMLVPPTLYAGSGDSFMLRPDNWLVVPWPAFPEGVGFVPVYQGTVVP